MQIFPTSCFSVGISFLMDKNQIRAYKPKIFGLLYFECKTIIDRAYTHNGPLGILQRKNTHTRTHNGGRFVWLLLCSKAPDRRTHSTDKLTNHQCLALSVYFMCVLHLRVSMRSSIEIQLKIPWERFFICSPFNRIRRKALIAPKPHRCDSRASIRGAECYTSSRVFDSRPCIHTHFC